MADKEHLDLLKQGVGVWNACLSEIGRILPNRTVALCEAEIRSADFSRASLIEADISGDDIYSARLYKIDLSKADISRADLRGANLCDTDISGANLRGANLCDTDISRANLYRANLCNADISRAYLCEVYLGQADLSRANLSETDLSGANLRRARLCKANLTEASLGSAYLCGADFSGADFSRADLRRADLSGADFSGANFSGANLSWANSSRTNFSRANFSGANLTGTNFLDVDLTEAKGLESCMHHGPSVIDYRTLVSSKNLPINFWRACGLPEALIDYLPSLTGSAIEFYSCFISYSSKDQKFADRLHADLQNNGVRCWFAPHDLPIGAKTWDGIDQAIRTRDKVLLILSEGAIDSDWVENEVTTAFAEERRRDELVLFPVRLDGAVIETDEPWARKLRDNRNIGNFSHWKDHDAYNAVFERVLRDLKAKP